MSAGEIGLVTCGLMPTGGAPIDPLAVALEARGVRVRHAPWDDPTVAWGAFELCVIRSPRDYLERHKAFVAWADRAAMVTELWNPIELIRWNVHREYLLELGQRGVPVLPTAVVRSDESVLLAEVCEARGWREAVLKPAISAGPHGTTKVVVGSEGAQDELEARQRFGDVIVQPFEPSILETGEIRVVFVGREPVATVRRRPASEDFGVKANKMLGGEEAEADARVAAAAAAALEVLGRRVLHARADFLLVDGEPQLIEFELIDPSPAIAASDTMVPKLADAIARFAG